MKIKLSQGAAEVVASDVRSTVAAFDAALLTLARMCASVLEASEGSGVPISHSQRVLRSITGSMNAVVDGRADVMSLIGQLQVIAASSEVPESTFGCPTGAGQSEPEVLSTERTHERA